MEPVPPRKQQGRRRATRPPVSNTGAADPPGNRPPSNIDRSSKASSVYSDASGRSSNYQRRPPSSNVSSRPASTVSTGAGHLGPGHIPGYSRQTSPNDVHLDMSRHSQASSTETVVIGGIQYPVGSRVGSSGMFVIGDPGAYRPHDKSSDSINSQNTKVSMSTVGSHRHLVPRDKDYPTHKGTYNFDDWNWTIIRFVCLGVVFALLICLLLTTIIIVVQHKQTCRDPFNWWQGALSYQIPVPYFYDKDNNNIGDLAGVEDKIAYMKYLGVSFVTLNNMTSSESGSWDLFTDFGMVDERVGDINSLKSAISAMHDEKMQVLLDLQFVHTSKQHPWFIDSQQHKVSYQSQYEKFYVWSLGKDLSIEGEWEWDIERNAFYLHRGDPNKPLLDWTQHRVQNKITGIMRSWLERGIDGFIIRELENLYTTSPFTVPFIITEWRDLLDEYSTNSQKILVIEDSYLYNARAKHSGNDSTVDRVLEDVDMVEVAFRLGDNTTYRLQNDVKKGLALSQNSDDPWILWKLENLEGVVANYSAALQWLIAMVPGTPSLVGGQEVGKYYQAEAVANPVAAPMLWKSDSLLPYNPGSLLGKTAVDGYREITLARQDSYTLRQDSVVNEDNGVTKEYNLRWPHIDSKIIALERIHLKADDSYYYVANFGKQKTVVNLFHIAARGDLVCDTRNEKEGSINLQELELDRGQAVVFRIKY